jgi:hypothetical protein
MDEPKHEEDLIKIANERALIFLKALTDEAGVEAIRRINELTNKS